MSHPDITVDLLPSGALRLGFPYDPYLVNLIRQLPGRRWHAEQKFWELPRPSFRSLRELSAGAGVGLAVSERVARAFALGQERQGELVAAKADETPFALPIAASTTPHGYQYAGIRFVRHALRNFHGALIADDMGLGKTMMALSVVAVSERLTSVLVLCPSSLKYVWASEIEKHYPQLSYTVINGSAAARREQWAAPATVKIANYELLLRDVEIKLAAWDLVVADEITFLKNYKAKRTRAAKKLRARYRLGLSGIPLENRLEELHSVMDWVIPGLLGPGWLFVQEHVVRNQWGVVLGYRGIEKVKERIAPYFIRRRKEDVLTELPPKVYTDVDIELSDAEWRVYDAIVRQIKDKIAENPKLSALNILTELLRLKQVTADARLVDEEGVPSSKVAALRDIIEGSGDRQIVVFTQFAQFARLLAKDFTGAALIAGSVKPQERQKVIEAFQRGEHRLLISTDAGAYGITLTAADVVIMLDMPWTPARLRQREDRLHRIGQTASVQVINLIARRTVDEKVRRILHKKNDLIRAVLDEEAPDADAIQVTRGDVMRLLSDEE
jgi:SNF2 family DNA or RNA helicase